MVGKLSEPASFEITLMRLIPAGFWRAAAPITSRTVRRAVLTTETAMGSLLVANSFGRVPWIELPALALFIGLLAIVLVAWRRKVPCGCTGRTRHAAGPVDVQRGVVLVTAAVVVAVTSPTGTSTGWDYAGVLGVSGVLCLASFGWAPISARVRRRGPAGAAIAPAEPQGHVLSRRSLIAGAAASAVALLMPAGALPGANDAAAKCCGIPFAGNIFCFILLEGCISECMFMKYIDWKQSIFCMECCDMCWLVCEESFPGCPINSCGGAWMHDPAAKRSVKR